MNRDIRVTGVGAYISDQGIQVTPDWISSDQRNRAGRATYIRQLHLWDKTSRDLVSFTTNFSFVMDSMKNDSYGDGLTFFLAKNNSLIFGGGSMGLPISDDATNVEINPFVAVEFDSYGKNDWDPKDSNNMFIGDHVGIDVNSLTSVKFQKWFTNITYGRLCQTWIKYDAVSKDLSVSFTAFHDNIVAREVELRYTIDLRNVFFEWVIFGFSAATGDFFQKNNVQSWAFNSSVLQIDENNEWPSITTPGPSKGTFRTELMVGLIVGSFVLISSLVVLVCFIRRRKKKNREDEAEEHGFDVEMNNEFELGTGPRRFSYLELAQSTEDFAEKEKLGEGGFGGVYKGFLKDSNTHVAVKMVSKASQQGIKEYSSEVKIISRLRHRLRHRNLVQLIGWCHEKGKLLLVYEFMENRSLDTHLFKAKSLLTSETRYQIAQGLASALLYLHEGWEQCVLHRDIKSSNVLLDSNFTTKLGDLGLAKLVDHDKGSQTTILAGTMGYMAPECVVIGKASRESEVFSFGVVALEIACGRKPIDHLAPEKKISLVEWVWGVYESGTLLEAADPRLGLDFKEEEMKLLMIVGLWCAHPDSDLRPSMRRAIQILKFEASLPTLPSKIVREIY